MQSSTAASLISEGDRQRPVTATNDQTGDAPASWSMDVATNIDVPSLNVSFAGQQLLSEYTRDADKQLVSTVKTYFNPSPHLKDKPNLTKDFDDSYTPEQGKLEKPKFSIMWFLDYLDSHISADLLKKNRPHFVCAVSTLRILLCSPYEYEWMNYATGRVKSRDWKIYCKKVNGIWYLSEAWQDYNDGVTPSVKYAARVFELLNTETGSLREARGCAKDYRRHRKTYQVFLSSLGKYSLLYSGDVDCFDKTECTVELKTTTKWTYDVNGKKQIDPPVSLHHWAQALLMKVKKVFVGYTKRNEKNEMILEGTEEFDTELIKKINASATGQPTICIHYLESLLRSINDQAFFQDEKSTYELRLDKEAKKIIAEKSSVEFPMHKCMD